MFFSIFRMLRTGARFSSKFSGCSAREHDFERNNDEILRMLRTELDFLQNFQDAPHGSTMFHQNFEDAPHGSTIFFIICRMPRTGARFFFKILRMLRTGTRYSFKISRMPRTGARFSSKFSGCSARERDFLAIFIKRRRP